MLKLKQFLKVLSAGDSRGRLNDLFYINMLDLFQMFPALFGCVLYTSDRRVEGGSLVE